MKVTEPNVSLLGVARLFERLSLDPARDVEILFTNVAIPDQAFGASLTRSRTRARAVDGDS